VAKKKKPSAQPNMWGMLRDVLTVSMSKGQFPLALCGVIIVVVLVRMPSGDVSKLAFAVLAGIKSTYLLGYVLWLGCVMGWFFHVRWQRTVIRGEMQRISGERNKLQDKAAGRHLESSEE